MNTEPKLIANRCITPDGTLLQSMNRHDFAFHTDSITGEFYFTDGGLTYIRRSANIVPAVSADVWEDDSHEQIREALQWGSYGKEGDKELHYIALKDLTDNHLDAIIKTQIHIAMQVRNAMLNEKKYRETNNIYVKEQ